MMLPPRAVLPVEEQFQLLSNASAVPGESSCRRKSPVWSFRPQTTVDYEALHNGPPGVALSTPGTVLSVYCSFLKGVTVNHSGHTLDSEANYAFSFLNEV